MPIAAIGQYLEAFCRYKSYNQFPEGNVETYLPWLILI
jgi:hypothetical protein